MKQFNVSPDQIDAAKPFFAQGQAARELMQSDHPATIGASRLFAYIQGSGDEFLANNLTSDFTLFRTYKTLLKSVSKHHIPMAIAASSEDFPKRDLEGCIVRIQEARADSDEVYLIIELKDKNAPLPTKLHLTDETDTERLDLPMGRNGIVQTILTKSSKAVQLFKNPKTELFFL